MRSGVKMWWSTKFNSWKGTFGMDNIPLIRISEVLLNRAEAYAHLADNTSLINARTDIDELRKTEDLILQMSQIPDFLMKYFFREG